jgi:hypothetical protein
VILAGLAVCWVLVVMWTGGGVIHLGGVRIASRGPRNPALLVGLSLLAAWALGSRGRRAQDLAADYRELVDLVARRLPRLPSASLVAAFAAAAVVIVGVVEGAFVVGGSDSYGYVSQAHLWSIGALTQEPVLLRTLAPDVGIDALTPLGYRPRMDGTTIAPSYSPGLPMVMAVFERVAGPASVFWVVPLLAGVLVWTTYLLGVRVHGSRVGAVAAVLVASSSPLLVQLTDAPLSDLPAAAWWTLSFWLASLDRRMAALCAGVTAGAAILTRPNLVPLVAIVVAVLVARLIVARRPVRDVVQHVLLVSVFPIAACLTIAALNRAMWGSALNSGYGSLSTLFSVSNVWTNLHLYPRVIAMQIPIAVLAPFAFVRRDRVMTIALGAWVATVVAAYLVFPAYDSERNLRFLLPAVPPLVVLGTLGGASLLGAFVERHAVATLLTIAVIAGWGVHTARQQGTFATDHLRKFADAGSYIERELPQQAVLLAMLHSGSATYYSGRPTIRYDMIAPSDLDALVPKLVRRGYVPYLLLDNDERAAFQSHYQGHSRFASLDWPPIANINSRVQIYALGEDASRP